MAVMAIRAKAASGRVSVESIQGDGSHVAGTDTNLILIVGNVMTMGMSRLGPFS